MVLGPETDNMVQFMDPEIVNKGERSFMCIIVNFGMASKEVNSKLTQGRPQLIVILSEELIHFILKDRREADDQSKALNLPNVSRGGRDGWAVAELI